MGAGDLASGGHLLLVSANQPRFMVRLEGKSARGTNDELAQSFEVRTGSGGPQPPPLLHSVAAPQGRPCRLLLLVVSSLLGSFLILPSLSGRPDGHSFVSLNRFPMELPKEQLIVKNFHFFCQFPVAGRLRLLMNMIPAGKLRTFVLFSHSYPTVSVRLSRWAFLRFIGPISI